MINAIYGKKIGMTQIFNEDDRVVPVSAANTYELIDNKALVFTADALKRIEEVLA